MTSLTKTTSSVAGVNAVSVDGRGLAGHGGENGQDVLVAPDLQPAFLSGQISGTDGDILLGPVIARILQGDPEFRLWGRNPAPLPDAQVDYLFATPRQIHDPQAIFRRLRLGGQFVFAGRRREVRALCDRYMEWGFAIERPPGFVRRSWLLPFLGTKVHHFVARKVHLVAAGQTSERFTYDVQLEQRDCQYVICKRVPSIESVKQRLRKRWGDADEELLENRARKFTEKIFPTFLTRETAILKLLQEKLPAAYARHVPRVLDFEKDIRGYVRTLRMNWLRNGGAPLGQLEFARQSADLLRTIHDVAGIIHLDLRLDNFVVTSDGAGRVRVRAACLWRCGRRGWKGWRV